MNADVRTWAYVMRTLPLVLVLLGAFCTSAKSDQVPKDMSGDWIRIQGESVDTLSVGFTQGKLIVDDHLDGEGAECILSPSKLHVQQMAREQRKLVSVFGSASCQAEESAPQVNIIYLLYSRQTDGTEILIFADGSHQTARLNCFEENHRRRRRQLQPAEVDFQLDEHGR